MLKFFTQWTKKKIIITALSLTALTTAAVGVSSIIGSGGQSDVKLPIDAINGVAEKPQNATVADFLEDHKKNLYVANGVLITAGSFRTQTTGTTVSTKIGLSITQEIRAERAVKGNDVFKQSSSYGLVKMGDQRFASGESYLYRTASKVNSVNDIVWNAAAPSALSKSGYEARYGCRGNALSAYILNDQTIIDSSYDGFDEQTGLYAFSYVLDNEKATPQILYEMKTNSGSANFATFKSAKITVKIDKNWLIHSLFTDCSYDVPIFGNTPCKEQMTETFYDVGKINALSDLPEYDYFSPHFNAEPPLDGEADPPTPDATTALTTMFGEYLQGKPLNLKL